MNKPSPLKEVARGWRQRGYLPHYDDLLKVQSLTLRLFDSLPKKITDSINLLRRLKGAEYANRIAEKFLDKGYGSCCLQDPRIAQIVIDALFFFDGQRYVLHEFCVMPNHFHSLFHTLTHSIGSIVHSWKGYIRCETNKTLGTTGGLWHPDFYDRFIRNERHYSNEVNYILENPVKAGLVARAEDWPYSSAFLRKIKKESE
jgi:putative transposase